MTGSRDDDKSGKVRPFPLTSDRADELLRARSRNRPRPLPLPPLPPTHDEADQPASNVGYPVPPRRRPRAVSPRPSARELCRRDWFVAGLVLGMFAGAALTMVVVWTVLLFG